MAGAASAAGEAGEEGEVRRRAAGGTSTGSSAFLRRLAGAEVVAWLDPGRREAAESGILSVKRAAVSVRQ